MLILQGYWPLAPAALSDGKLDLFGRGWYVPEVNFLYEVRLEMCRW